MLLIDQTKEDLMKNSGAKYCVVQKSMNNDSIGLKFVTIVFENKRMLEYNQLLSQKIREQIRQFIQFEVLCSNSQIYWDLHAGVLQQTNNTDLTRITQRLSQIIISFLQDKETEKILLQAFNLICILLAKCQASLVMITTNEQLSDSIISILFQLNGKTLQSQDTIKAAYEIVQKLFANQKLMEILKQYFSSAFWIIKQESKWFCWITQSWMHLLYEFINRVFYPQLLNLDNKLLHINFNFYYLHKRIHKNNFMFLPIFVVYLVQIISQLMFMNDVDEFFLDNMNKLELELKSLKRDIIVPQSFGRFMSTELISKGCYNQ